jgi:hypothetical protein
VSILREQDKHEGTFNQATIEAHRIKKDQGVFSIFDIGSGLLRSFGKFIAVNCWHINPIESVAMWNIYLGGINGIAIQSTVQRLKGSFDGEPTREISIGKVHYLAEDQITPEPNGFNGFNSVLWKWKSYEYENELRAALLSRPEELYKYNGIFIPVKLDQLIEKVVVSPKAPVWFSELIVALASKHGFGDKVTPSRLGASPGSIDNNQVSISVPCPSCNTVQEIVVEPFIVKDYPDNSTTVFSADRVSTHCRNCGVSFYFPLRPQLEFSDSHEPSDKND